MGEWNYWQIDGTAVGTAGTGCKSANGTVWTAYAHAGPAFRALMTECMTEEGIEVPESWRA
jgi:hypothetical protein